MIEFQAGLSGNPCCLSSVRPQCGQVLHPLREEAAGLALALPTPPDSQQPRSEQFLSLRLSDAAPDDVEFLLRLPGTELEDASPRSNE